MVYGVQCMQPGRLSDVADADNDEDDDRMSIGVMYGVQQARNPPIMMATVRAALA